MQDPAPENITGEKQIVHKVEHRVNWGHVAVGIGLLTLALVAKRLVSESREDDEEMGGFA